MSPSLDHKEPVRCTVPAMTPPQRTDPSPGSTASLRAANQHRVLDVLRGVRPTGTAGTSGVDADPAEGVFTQAELARVTGLAPATVSNIVRELAGAGLVDTEAGSGRRGSSVRAGPRCRHRGRSRLRPQPRGGRGRRPRRPGAHRGAGRARRRHRPPRGAGHRPHAGPDARPGCPAAWAPCATSDWACPHRSPRTISAPRRSSPAGKASTPAPPRRTPSAHPCTSRTTRTWAPWPSTGAVSVAATTARSS